MELEEMKLLWTEMFAKVENQKRLTDSIIINMTQARYSNKINRIFIPELIGSVICIPMAVLLLANIQKLNSWYLSVCDIASALILVILPILSLRALATLRSVNIMHNQYKQSLQLYAKGKLQFVFVQKLSFCLTAVMMLLLLPVLCVIAGAKDPFKTSSLWLSYVIMLPFFYFFARWVFRKYIKMAGDAENILAELEH